MSDYPTDPAAREARRGKVLADRVARARVEAYRVVRSITCGEYHRHEPETTCAGALVCLCDCHDGGSA